MPIVTMRMPWYVIFLYQLFYEYGALNREISEKYIFIIQIEITNLWS